MPGQSGPARDDYARSPAAQQPVGQAPGRLRTLQAFVNTLDIEAGTEELGSPRGLVAWLQAADLLGPADTATPAAIATAADLAIALRLREALRDVLASHVRHGPGAAGDAVDDPAGDRQAAGELRRIAAALPTRLDVGPDGQVRITAAGTGVSAGLADLLLIAANAAATGTWDRLKVCRADDCRWAFYDRSPTRSGSWCSMRICGARAKSRAYRSRAGPATASRSARSAGPGA